MQYNLAKNSFVGFVWRAIHNSLCVDMFKTFFNISAAGVYIKKD